MATLVWRKSGKTSKGPAKGVRVSNTLTGKGPEAGDGQVGQRRRAPRKVVTQEPLGGPREPQCRAHSRRGFDNELHDPAKALG